MISTLAVFNLCIAAFLLKVVETADEEEQQHWAYKLNIFNVYAGCIAAVFWQLFPTT